MDLIFDEASLQDYQTFLRLKACPAYSWRGEVAVVPDEYSSYVSGSRSRSKTVAEYEPSSFCFDYQRDIVRMAIRKEKFAVFADCGLGKTIILLEFARHASQFGKVLIVAPLMVCKQTASEYRRFYNAELPIVRSSELRGWLANGSGMAITNYEAIGDDLPSCDLSGLILDESSMLKSAYGAYGQRLISLGCGVRYKMALTGTPAPNDRIEYANHAVFCEHVRTVNEFYAKYFINKGQTSERWVLKPHATKSFYRDLSHWCIFLNNPATYGWKDNCGTVPPIHVHLHDVDLTKEQRKDIHKLTGRLFGGANSGGIGTRSKLSQIAKGTKGGQSNKPGYIADLIASWSPDESTLVWCHYNPEQEQMEQALPSALSIDGSTAMDVREEYIEAFKSRANSVLISKPRILGFGLNLQVATRQVFNGMLDSYEEYYQAVKRSNRIGSTRPLNVHIPLTEVEEPMVANVLAKRDRVQQDTEEQEQLFKEYRFDSCH